MHETIITLNQLYLYVADYFVDAKQEGFAPSVGDFVDWIACQNENERDIVSSKAVMEAHEQVSRALDELHKARKEVREKYPGLFTAKKDTV